MGGCEADLFTAFCAALLCMGNISNLCVCITLRCNEMIFFTFGFTKVKFWGTFGNQEACAQIVFYSASNY